MKRILCTFAALLLLICSFSACSCEKQSDRSAAEAIEDSAVWSLAERYPSKYTTLAFVATYTVNGEPFCLRVSRNKGQAGSSKRVRESKDVNGFVYTLCDSRETTQNGDASYSYYECLTGQFRYFVGRENEGFRVENYLSLDDAIAVMSDPFSPSEKIRLTETEWNAYFDLDACTLDILIRPGDGGTLVNSLSASHMAQNTDEDTIYVDKKGDDVAYTNGVDSVRIRQADRAGAEHTDYHTLSECKAILALLGS